MNPIQNAIAKISGIARQKFGDNQGFVQNNRLTMQPIRQAISTPADLMYTATKLSPYRATLGNMTRDQYKQALDRPLQRLGENLVGGTTDLAYIMTKMSPSGPALRNVTRDQYKQIANRPVKKFGEGFLEGTTVGLTDIDVAPSRNLVEKLAYGGGYVASVLNPYNPMNKVAGVIGGMQTMRAAQLTLGKTAAKAIAQKGLAKLAGLAIKGVSQGLPYTTAYGALNLATKSPQEAGESIRQDVGVDAVIGALPLIGGTMLGLKPLIKKNANKIDKLKIYDTDVEELAKIGRSMTNNFKNPDGSANLELYDQSMKALDTYNKDKGIANKAEWNKMDITKKFKTVTDFIMDKASAKEIEVLKPNVTKRTKLDPQGNVIAPGAAMQSVEDPILSEARKYKTPEEFVRAQGEVVYHGTTHKWEGKFREDKPIFITKDRKFAENVASQQTDNIINKLETERAPTGESYYPTIKDYVIKKDAKIFSIYNKEDFTKLVNKLPDEFNITNHYIGGRHKITKQNWLKNIKNNKNNWELLEGDVIDEIKKLGYDGWEATEKGVSSIGLFNQKALQTKSQLTDIWNKANNVGGIKRSPPVEVSGGVAGIEQYQDEQGNTQYRFNPIKGAAGIVGVKLAKDGKIRAFTQPEVKKLSAQELKEQLQAAQNNAQQAMKQKEYVDSVWGSFSPETRKAIGKIRTQLNNLEAKGADMTNVSLSSAYKKSFDDVMATLGTNSEDEALTFIKNMPDRQVKGVAQEIKIANQLSKEMERRQTITNQPLNSQTVGQSLSDMVIEGYDPKALKERGFTETIRKAQISQDKLKEGAKAMYEPITNPKTLKQAKESIADDITTARDRVFEEDFSAETSAIGQELIRKYQEKGDWTQAINMIEVLAQKATKAGQANQALSMWSRFTPEGMLKFAERTIKKANEDQGIITKGVRKAMGFLPTKLDELTAKNITELMDKANKATNEDDKIKYTRLAMEEISSRLPYGISDLIDEMRYNNMLSGPLTHVRNAWSNALQVGATRPLTILFQGKPKEVAQYYRGVVTAIPTAVNKAIDSMRGNAPYRALDIELKQGLRPKPRLGLYNIPTRLLEASDQFFGTMVKSGEIARGESKEKAEMLAEALLFRGGTKPKGQGHLLNKIDDVTSAISTLRRVGLGWAVPFLRTPMNVAKQWIEYSPAGVLTLPGSQNKREQLAKMMIGSTVTMMGVKLAMEGRTTWSAPTDPTEKKLFYDSGRKPYSVKMGDKWVPMQYFGTFAWAMGLPAAMQYYQKEQRNALTDDQMTKIGKGLLSLGGFWSNQTFVSGLGSFVNVMQGKDDYTLSKTLGYTIGQLNPMTSLQRYIATVIDPIFRKPKGFVQQLQSGIPIMSKKLNPYETSTGEPARRDITNYIAPYPIGTVKQEFEDKYQQRKQRIQENAYINAYTSDKPNISPVLRQKAESMEIDRKAQDKFTYYTTKLDAYNQTKDKKAGASLYYGIKNSKTLTPEMKADLLKELPVPESKSKSEQTTTKATKTKKTRVKKAKKTKIKKLKAPKLSAKLPKAKKIKATKVKVAKIKLMKPPKLAKVKARTRSSLTQA